MYILLLSLSIPTTVLGYAMLFRTRKPNQVKIKIYKGQNDTSDANYAVNEHGFLERIYRDKLSKHSN